LSGLVVMIFLLLLLFSINATANAILINQQEASVAFFHEKLFGEGSSSIAKAQLATDVKSSNTPATTTSSKQTGTPANDNIRGSGENDVIVGLAGNDIISGQAGNDNIDGSEGNDYIIGGPGNDTLARGEGQDNYICGAGKDIVLDFNATEGDIRSDDCEVAGTTANNNITGE
jgi:Ca2+-binding RTX toxin-like protein